MNRTYEGCRHHLPDGATWKYDSLALDTNMHKAVTRRIESGTTAGAGPMDESPTRSQDLLKELLASCIVLPEDVDQLPSFVQEELARCGEVEDLLSLLVKHGLLTEYQATRVAAGKTFGLLLDNYRVLERLGAGSMGVVFKAENRRMRRPVAIKVLAESHEQDRRIVQRFFAEMRAVSQLQHPNIVAALDAGETAASDLGGPTLHYLVMEYVPGEDLERYVLEHGPMTPAMACDVIHQGAAALAEAHRHHLIHRDIKPSNIRVTPEGQVKLLDFGLTRHFSDRLTQPGAILGTLEFMAPEQAADARSVDIRADIYGLGGTLYWCLTGRAPFPTEGGGIQDFARRLDQPPPAVRAARPEVAEGLEAVVSCMMAVNPDDRYQTPEGVMKALLPFLKPDLREDAIEPLSRERVARGLGEPNRQECSLRARQILIVDDEPSIRTFCRYALQTEETQHDEVADGRSAMEIIKTKPYDLVLLDVDMPVMNGTEVLTRLRESPPWPNLKIIMFSGRSSADEMASLLMAGADDYLTKPFSIVQLRARVNGALRLKEAQDRSDLLNRHLLSLNSHLERNLTALGSDLVQARNALVLALAKLVEYRDSETGSHLTRLQRYCHCLAHDAAKSPAFADQIDAHFIDMLECCAPLHDIGKVGLPDHILLKPGKLTPDERIMMQAHTVIGADTLSAVAQNHGFALVFLQMANDIARHHHERFDGSGYPDRLAGSDIPLAARLVAIADVYDALRSRRVYKPALAHSTVLQLMTQGCSGQFDPALLVCFQRCHQEFEHIFNELAG
jgi:response regulator RpfG family c-di-GMP phosphodiesterase